MLQKIDVIHRLRQIAEGPARQANIFRCLQLIIKLEQPGELMVIRRAFAYIVGPFEVLKESLNLFDLPLGIIEVFFVFLLLMIVVMLGSGLLIQVSRVNCLDLHRRLLSSVAKVSLILSSPLFLSPLLLQCVCVQIHLSLMPFIFFNNQTSSQHNYF